MAEEKITLKQGEYIRQSEHQPTDDEKINAAAKIIMDRFKPAFEELAK